MSNNAAARPIHVLTITPFYPHEGDDSDGCFVAEPLAHLPEFNVTSSVIAAKPVSKLSFKANGESPQAVWVRHRQLPGMAAYPSWGLMLYARLSRHVARLHKEQKIDLIHAHAALPCGQPAAMLSRRLRIPFVVTTHGLDVFSRRREQGPLRFWCDHISRSVYKQASQNICVSEAVRREMVKVLGDSVRATVVYNGVDTELFAPPREMINGNGATILSVGRLTTCKGQDVTLRAVAKLVREYPALRYEIVGDGSERARFTALAEELGIADRVVFFGTQSREEVAERMKRCDVFALPSSDEALGCVYLEAMATSKPVIGCRNQGIEEIIQQGENGWLIEPDNVDELAETLRTLLDDAQMRERIGREARKTIVEGFSLAHQAEQLNEVYRACLEKPTLLDR